MYPLGPLTRDSATAKFRDTHDPMHVLKKKKKRKGKETLTQYLCIDFQHYCARNLKIHFGCGWWGGGC